MFEKEAEEYVIKKHHIDKTKLPIDFSLRCEFSDDFTDFQKGAVFGYQKGVQKLDKKWHSLQKNPKDLPDACMNIVNQDGEKVRYDYVYEVWRMDDANDYICDTPIAWCEVPTFEE